MMKAGKRLAILSNSMKDVEESDLFPRRAVKGDRDPLVSIGLLHDLNIASLSFNEYSERLKKQ
jgi:hypothetical protein